ncbi:MAG: hypothetical protein J6S67_22110 [Methanobrevibacter sp.]|nr:hypothetical protein [Methanobrevibacter sp.]
MIQRKINIYLNGAYICSTMQYKTCKAALNAIRNRGFIEYAGANWLKTRVLDKIVIKDSDKLKARFI